MKIVIGTILVFAVLLGFGVVSYYYIDNTASQLVSKASLVEQSGKLENWRQTEKEFSALQSAWQTTSTKWTTLIDHQELDNINISMAKIWAYIKAKDTPGFRSEIAQLKLLIRHIPEKEALSLKNIL